MNTTHLNIFIDCMRIRNFTEVAKLRNIDPATVTRAITALEGELTVKLFQRTTRRIEPTEAGQVYFDRIESIVEELHQAKLATSGTLDKPKGVLRISAPVSFAQMNITPLLPIFAEHYPGISFEYILTDEDLDLVAHHIDVGIRVGSLQDSQMIAVKLAPMETRVCATSEYCERFGRPLQPADLSNHKCLVLGYRGFARNRLKFQKKHSTSTKTVAVDAVLTTSNAMAIKQCTLAGMGISLLATWMIKDELKNGQLIDLFPDMMVSSALQEAAAWLIYPSREYLPNKTRLFIDFLKEKFR